MPASSEAVGGAESIKAAFFLSSPVFLPGCLLTLPIGCGKINRKVNSGFSASGPVGPWKRIGNRVQLPSGTATVSAEVPA